MAGYSTFATSSSRLTAPLFQDPVHVRRIVTLLLPAALFAILCLPFLTPSRPLQTLARARARLLARAHTYARVLVTGFEPFDNFSVNPSLLVSKMMGGKCTRSGVCFESLEVSVTPPGVQCATSHIRRYSYDGVVLLGLENSAKGLRLEIAARNIAMHDSHITSVSANLSRAIDNGPSILATTAPLDRVSLRQLRARDIGELWSTNAGSYACNELYYRALYIARSRQGLKLVPTIFVHLPNSSYARVSDIEPIIARLAELLVSR